jgi:two-component system nitrate/nitrite response regulator NarL
MSRPLSFATIVIGKSGLIREGISRILAAANSRTLASISSIEEVRLRRPGKSPLLFLLVHTDGDRDFSLEQIEFLKSWAPASRIAIVADRYRPGEPLMAFRAGVSGYFVNVTSCPVFIKSIELIMMGETIFPPEFLSPAHEAETGDSRLIAISPPLKTERTIFFPVEDAIAPHLSPRERSILRCLIEGASNKTIARKMDIAEATVKVHVKAILRKIGVQNRTQAAIWGVNNDSLTGINGNSQPKTAIMTT